MKPSVVVLLASMLLVAGCASRCPPSEKEWAQFLHAQRYESLAWTGEHRCQVHNALFEPMSVNTVGGRPVYLAEQCEYVKAKISEFPNSFLSVECGSCPHPDWTETALVCPICRGNEIKWLTQHGSYVPLSR
jgi:hypothetical protein